jgi:hypothetical protein
MRAFLAKRIEISWLKLIAYITGIWMCIHGAFALHADIESATTWAVMKDQVFQVLFMVWGVLICAAAWFRYRGGLWSVAGAFLLGGALHNSALIVEVYMRDLQLDSPVSFCIRTALLGVAGGVLAVIGHIRHRRKTMPNKSLQATAAAPSSCD